MARRGTQRVFNRDQGERRHRQTLGACEEKFADPLFKRTTQCRTDADRFGPLGDFQPLGTTVVALFMTVQTVAGFVHCGQRWSAVIGEIKPIPGPLGLGSNGVAHASLARCRDDVSNLGGRSARLRQAKETALGMTALTRFGLNRPGRVAAGSIQPFLALGYQGWARIQRILARINPLGVPAIGPTRWRLRLRQPARHCRDKVGLKRLRIPCGGGSGRAEPALEFLPEGVGVQLFDVGCRNLQYGLTTNEFPLDPKKGFGRSGLIPQVCDGFADTEQLADEAFQRRAECQ